MPAKADITSAGRPPAAGITSRHVPSLDGLRGIAILLVMGYHYIIYSGLRPLSLFDKLLFAGASMGTLGVDLFFILSGFLITSILLETRGRPRFFANFYVRRALRIFPLYYGFLLLVFVLLAGTIPGRLPASVAKPSFQIWFWTYLQNVLFALKGWPEAMEVRLLVGHFWSLAVEEQFYLVWPFLVWLLPEKSFRKLCLVVIVGAMVVRALLLLAGQNTAAFVLTPARADGLALGALMAVEVRNRSRLVRALSSRWAAMIAAVVFTGAFLLGRGFHESGWATVGGWAWLILGFCALGAALEAGPQGIAVLRHPALVACGKYSYALYVFHHPIIYLVLRWGWSLEKFETLLGSRLGGLLAFALLNALFSFGVALASWHLWEKHFLKLKDRFTYCKAVRPVPAHRAVEESGGCHRG